VDCLEEVVDCLEEVVDCLEEVVDLQGGLVQVGDLLDGLRRNAAAAAAAAEVGRCVSGNRSVR
jgi:hypothetical protein